MALNGDDDANASVARFPRTDHGVKEKKRKYNVCLRARACVCVCEHFKTRGQSQCSLNKVGTFACIYQS